MSAPLAQRDAAEAIEAFGNELCKLVRAFDRQCERMPGWIVDRINALPNQDQTDSIAEEFRKLGDELCRELDAAEEADDRRRASPLARDFRRIG